MLLTSGWGPDDAEIQHFFHLPEEQRQREHGRGTVEFLTPVVAGEITEVKFTFQIGEREIPPKGKLGIAWRWPFDWDHLQFEDPAQPGFVEVSHPDLRCSYHAYTGVEPWHHHLDLEAQNETLRTGESVTITCHNWPAPTCISSGTGFLMLVDPEGTDKWIRLVDPPLSSIPSAEPSAIVVIAPSEMVVDELGEALIRIEDRWGNPVPIQSMLPDLKVPTDQNITSGKPRVLSDASACWIPITFHKTGTFRLQASLPRTDLIAESNPIRVLDTAPEHRIFWGDFHAGQCEIGCGQGSISQHYQFGRDVAGLQFITHQGNDHYVTLDEWNHIREVTKDFYKAGHFVPFLGCEWSPPTIDGGDRNVAYLHDEPRLRRSGRFWTETDPDPEPDIPRAPEFLSAMKDEEVLINIHVGGRPTNLDWYEPAIEKLAEIHSTHGTSEWFIFDALSRGYQVAITAGTDGVMGRPGADQPGRRLIRNLPNGLTAVYATELTREAMWDALKARRCYATNGSRIFLDVDVNGHPMGAECQIEAKPLITIKIEGTAALERIDLFRGTDIICTWNLAQPQTQGNAIRILWGGTERKGTARAQTVNWNGKFVLEDVTIVDYQKVGYFAPIDEVHQLEDGSLEWKSATAGNDAGLVLTLEGSPEARGTFISGPCSFDFRLGQVSLAPMIVSAGGVHRRVAIGPALSENGPRCAEVSFRDVETVDGVAPYWVRVTQIDQGKAWSSPVYATGK